MRPRIGLGISDFRQLREAGGYLMDKSGLLVELLDDLVQVVLFTRPRRFGKTLNLSMLRYFLEKSEEDRSPLFSDLAVWRSDAARRHFARYPVIFLSFKDIKTTSFTTCLDALRRLLAAVYGQHLYLLGSSALSPVQTRDFQAVLDGSAPEVLCWTSLADLSGHLARYHGEKTVILIDEYDTPIHAGFAGGYYAEITIFFRNFLGAALKDNPTLFRGALTGVLRVAKESIFSGLNNIMVQSVLSPGYSTAFGFTEAEVRALAEAMGRPAAAMEIARWYDGYRFGGTTIYNPWSILSYARQPDRGFQPHWVLTSANDVLRTVVFEQPPAMAGDVEALLKGEVLTRQVTEHLVLRELDRQPAALLSLLLHTGYLTTRSLRLEKGCYIADLVLPNEEMRYIFEQSITSWVEHGLHGEKSVRLLLRAMLAGDEAGFGELLTTLVLRTFSYHDMAGPEPERVYQAFLLGLLVYLEPSHEVRSNRESGYGRYDVMVLPRQAGQPGVVLECKQLSQSSGETVDQALAAALQQIADRRYTEELAAAHASPIIAWGLVFDGKRAWVRRE
ncbi:MAG: hypothetical protein FJ125_06885 [Deltaproteobacteria bacterium]|nr:hypothetical protein [Deltaproteobacteria bacterium]